MSGSVQALPKGPEGVTCPLLGKDCSETCHKCMFWRRVDFESGRSEWDCALVWAFRTGLMNGWKLDGVQKTTEQTRNAMVEHRQSTVALVAGLAKAADLIEDAQPPRKLMVLEDGSSSQTE